MKGFTLVEILIAMMLGVMITGAVFQIFMIIHQNLMVQQGIARISENARAIDHILGKAIRAAGNIGCTSLRSDLSLRIHEGVNQSYQLGAKKGILLVDKNQNFHHPLLAKKHAAKMQAQSDILWINQVNITHPLAHATDGSDGYIVINQTKNFNKNNFKANKIAILSDCIQADVFSIAKVKELNNATNLIKIFLPTLSQKNILLSKYYSKKSQLGILRSAIYYVGKTNRYNGTNRPVYALYRTDFNGVTTELVEGVEWMEIEYGIYQNQQFRFVKAASVLNNNIVSVKISALLSSIEDGLSSAKPYEISGKTYFPSDRLIRKWIDYEWNISNQRVQS